MEHDVAIWHYIAGLGIFCGLGVVAHICRALSHPFPDRMSDRSTMGMGIGDCANDPEGLLGADYDGGGHYKLNSLRNLRNAVALSAFSGLCVMLLSPDVAAVMARVIDTGLGSMDNLLALRMEAANWS